MLTKTLSNTKGFFIFKLNIMNSKVTVAADLQGNVIGISKNNPEYGYVRVEQNVVSFNNEGWMRSSTRSALIKGKVEDLVAFGFKENQTLLGKIVVKESLTPFNTENPDRDLKLAGDTGVVCRLDDQPIYRQSFYTQDENAIDELISHTNKEEIRETQAATKQLRSFESLSATLP